MNGIEFANYYRERHADVNRILKTGLRKIEENKCEDFGLYFRYKDGFLSMSDEGWSRSNELRTENDEIEKQLLKTLERKIVELMHLRRVIEVAGGVRKPLAHGLDKDNIDSILGKTVHVENVYDDNCVSLRYVVSDDGVFRAYIVGICEFGTHYFNGENSWLDVHKGTLDIQGNYITECKTINEAIEFYENNVKDLNADTEYNNYLNKVIKYENEKHIMNENIRNKFNPEDFVEALKLEDYDFVKMKEKIMWAAI